MKKDIQLICIPEKGDHRFMLGKKGVNNLLVIALNPNTASGNQHDSTTRNIEKIAKNNGFDGWVLFNLSPVREPKPHNLLDDTDLRLQEENLSLFKELIDNNAWQIKNVWLAWGNGVILKNYLREMATEMLLYLRKKSVNYYCIKRTKQHHPYHSAQRVLNSFFKKDQKILLQDFPAQAYREFILEYKE